MNSAVRSEDRQLFLAASTLQRFNVAKPDGQRPADQWDVGIAHVDDYIFRNMPKRINRNSGAAPEDPNCRMRLRLLL